jgi:hypothetical protein
MANNARNAPPNLRGTDLDRQIDLALSEMLTEGLSISPISRSTVQKRLKLKSRSTLVGKRALRIEEAQRKQLNLAGVTVKQSRRATQQDRIARLQEELLGLRAAKDRYFASLAEIVQLLQSRGLSVEAHLTALRSPAEKEELRS